MGKWGCRMRSSARISKSLIALLTILAVLAPLACQGQQAMSAPNRDVGPPGPLGPASSEAGPRVSPEAALIEVNKSVLSTSDDPFTIGGNGFQNGEPIVLMLRIDGSLSIVLGGARGAQAIADEDGSFTITFGEIGMESRFTARAVGRRAFVAMGSDGSKASVPVQIVNGT